MTLSPVVVAFHFLLSMVMIALSTMLLRGSEDGWSPDGTADLEPRELLVPHLVSTLAWVTAGYAPPSSCWGRSSRGLGPTFRRRGEPARTGFDPRSVAWLHADVVMLFVGLVVAVLVAVCLTSSSDRAKATWRGVLLVTLLQGRSATSSTSPGCPRSSSACTCLARRSWS